MKLVHGGDTVGYRERYGHDALDFSANVSPLACRKRWRAPSARRRFRRINTPIRSARALTAALSQTEAVPKAWILCGNGAADLIFRLALAEKPQACTGSRADVRRIRGGAGNGRLRDSSAYAA